MWDIPEHNISFGVSDRNKVNNVCMCTREYKEEMDRLYKLTPKCKRSIEIHHFRPFKMQHLTT